MRSLERAPAELKEATKATAPKKSRLTHSREVRIIFDRHLLTLNFFRHNIRWPIAPAQQAVRLVISNNRFLRGIESQCAPQPVRRIRQMHKRRRDMGFFNR